MNGSFAADNHSSIPLAADLRQDAIEAQREGKPVLVLFTMPGCSYCHVIRQNYLVPLLKAADRNDRPIIREVDLTSLQSLIWLDGERMTHKAFSISHRIRFAPTVIFLNAQGEQLAEPLVGGDTAGMYGAYFDNRLSAAAQKMAVQKRTPLKEKQ
ncbi:thioredoxin family protein [Herbaspirillum sp. GCM10030257]|uniref:thioredoxin family protein n=1 Tax=Herbaspirillum sp. GCM10030257 TaxID=3273393 RepID=UPI00361F5DEB